MKVDARGIALVVVAVSTLQVGAAFAVTLFDEVGTAGAALLRLGIAALVLVASGGRGSPATRAPTCSWRSRSGSRWAR